MKKISSLVTIALLFTQCAFADGEADITSMLDSMKQQMSRMQQTIDTQNMRIQQLESRKVLEAPQAPVQVQPAQVSDADFEKGIKDNIGKAIPWLKGAKFGGDMRLRMENFDYFDKGTDSPPSDRSRNRYRFRLRWGFEKDYGDDWKVGFRLASGSSTDNTSTNQTLGNRGYFTFKDIFIEKVYALYSPNGLKDYGPIKGVTIGAGKVDNPFLRYSTPIVWDGDVTPEGLFEKTQLQLVSTENNKLNLNLLAGQFLVNENAANEADAQLFGYQGALNWSTYNFGTEQPVDFTIASSFYDYTNWSQTVQPAAANTAATSYLRTNTIQAGDFRVLDIYPEIQFYVNRTPITLWYDYATNVENIGTDDAAALNRTIHDMDEAWGLGFKIGKAKKKGQWELHYGYYEIGANAVVAAFNDSDFGGPGGNGHTNRVGHKFGLSYLLTDNISLNWTGYIVRPLDVTTLVANSQNEHVFRSQADIVYKF